MDRQSTSTNPLFMEQDDDMNSFVTKSHLFGAQRALHQEQQAMSERIDYLAADLRLSEQRTRDYFDHKLDDHKQENDARMDEIRALLLNRSSSTSRRSRSSRHSEFTLSGSSTPTSNTLCRAVLLLLSTALDFPEEERMMQQSSISISLSFWEPMYQSSRRPHTSPSYLHKTIATRNQRD